VVLLDPLQIGTNHLLYQYQLLLLQLLCILQIFDNFVAELSLSLGLEIGLVDKLLLFDVDISFALDGLEILLLVIDRDDGTAHLRG
jgi:hypothetical protein